jgi:folate-binding protein YgfZ
VSGIPRIHLGRPALLDFRGPDAVRYLNGQLTQDVRLVSDGKRTLPSCVTDAKGKLQFRVWVTGHEGALMVEGFADTKEALEARLTRYLIADDVEVVDLTGSWSLVHFAGVSETAPEGVIVRSCNRYGVPGTDWWIPADLEISFPEGTSEMEGESLEAFRIAHSVPAWGKELTEGILPPEAGLDATDISYQKGCYIGQEVISRIKSAGKVNKKLVRLTFDAAIPIDQVTLVDAHGNPAGEITSVSPLSEGGQRHALAYLKRGAEGVMLRTPDGSMHAIL